MLKSLNSGDKKEQISVCATVGAIISEKESQTKNPREKTTLMNSAQFPKKDVQLRKEPALGIRTVISVYLYLSQAPLW